MKLIGNVYDRAKHENLEEEKQKEIYDFLKGYADADWVEE